MPIPAGSNCHRDWVNRNLTAATSLLIPTLEMFAATPKTIIESWDVTGQIR
jgi:hypothetical protein